MTVFVVDDDPSIRTSLQRLLKAAGYPVEVFSSAAEFLARPAADTPGCVLVDLRMPGMDGLELQRAISVERPVVLMSGAADVRAAVNGMKAGALDFLTKPFDEEQLLSVVENALAHDAARRGWMGLYKKLTPREREVCDGIVRGLPNKHIAFELGATETTIKVHRGRVMKKLKVDSVAQLVQRMIAFRPGFPSARAAQN